MTDAAAARAANQPPQKQDVQVVIPIAYGTQARPLTEAERAKHKDHTTAWTVYVRGPSGESLAYAVDRVIFHLHESIVPPVRTIVAPAPFEVHETGWGEFDIGIEVVFRGSGAAGLQPVKLTAPLKLFPESVDTAVYPALVGLKQVDPARPGWLVTEKYDEVVVSEPSAELYDAVVANVDRSWPIRGTVWDKDRELTELAKIRDTWVQANESIVQLQERYNEIQAELAYLRGQAPSSIAEGGGGRP